MPRDLIRPGVTSPVMAAVALVFFVAASPPRQLSAQQPTLYYGYFEFARYVVSKAPKDASALPLLFTEAGDTLALTDEGKGKRAPQKAIYDRKKRITGFMINGQLVEVIQDGERFRSKDRYETGYWQLAPLGFFYRMGGEARERQTQDIVRPPNSSLMANGTVLARSGGGSVIAVKNASGPGPLRVTKITLAPLEQWITTGDVEFAISGPVQFLGAVRFEVDPFERTPDGWFASPERRVRRSSLASPSEQEVLGRLLPTLDGAWKALAESRLRQLAP